MRGVLIRGGVALAALLFLGVLWLATARRITELVDAVATIRVASLSPSPFGWNGTWLQFGPPTGVREPLVGRLDGIDANFRSLDLTGPGPSYGTVAEIAVNAEGKLVLAAAGRSLVLASSAGTISGGHGDVMPGFVAEPGDRVSLDIERSLMAWPTPFEFNVAGLGGTATTWKRYVYYRLSWVKPSGARLSMLWIGEQPYDGNNLWRAPSAFLSRVEIR